MASEGAAADSSLKKAEEKRPPEINLPKEDSQDSDQVTVRTVIL
jgi:hypothetical protein